MESESHEDLVPAPEAIPPPPSDSAVVADDEEVQPRCLIALTSEHACNGSHLFVQVQNNPPPPPSDSGSEENDDDVKISINAAGRASQLPLKKRQTSAVVNIPKRSSKTDISHVFRAVADAAPSEQAVVVTAFETEIDNLEDKPWRAEGADPSDWFNYGFNEETWRRYCEKQMRIRREYAGGGAPPSHMQQHPPPMYPPQQHMPPPHIQQQQQHPAFQQQMQPPRYDGQPPRGRNKQNPKPLTNKILQGNCSPPHVSHAFRRAAPAIHVAAHPTQSPRNA